MGTTVMVGDLRRGRFAAALLATLICAVALPTTASASTISSRERAAVGHINAYRRSHGLRPVRVDLRLSRAATWMGRDMARHNYFGHVDSRRRDPFTRMASFSISRNAYLGENLAAGYASPALAFQQWRNSPEHNRVMLTGNYRAVGVALVHDSTSPYRWYWVTDFSSRLTNPG